MNIRALFQLFCLLFTIFSHGCSAQEKRIVDQMYVSFDRARFCVRRLNSTHEIGCQSNSRGNSGRMFMIDSDLEFNSFIFNDQIINESSEFIIVININLFDSNYIDRLMARLGSKLNGILVYLKSNSTRPMDFSHDDQCPNNRQSFHLNQSETIPWNARGTGLFFRSFPFPMMLIDDANDYQRLVSFYRHFNTDKTSMACGLELKTFQRAAHTSKTCMRRNDISYGIIDFPDPLCDPAGGANVYGQIPQSIKMLSTQRPLKSVILILTQTDSFQMFLKSQGSTGGVQQPALGLITFLSLAHLIGQAQNELKKQDKDILFLTLDGDSLDYAASFRFMFEMMNGNFPTSEKGEQPIKVEHIHSIFELQSLSMTEKLWLHAYPSSLMNRTFIDTLLKTNPMINETPMDSPLPPASSQIFLRQTSSSAFPAYILSSADQNKLNNHYYHSFLDDLQALSINISTLEYNSTTQLSQWIKNIAEPLAQTLLESLVNVKKRVTIKQEIINNLVYCILKNINCPLIHNVTTESISNIFRVHNNEPMPFSVNTYPPSSKLTVSFVQYVLGYFLRDRSYDFENITEAACKEQSRNETVCVYNFVGGYLPSIDAESRSSEYCVRSYVRFTQSSSPAFIIDGYDLSNTTYPAWTESRWHATSLRLFIIPTKTHELVILVTGILLTSSSFFFLLFLRYYTTIGLLQPSSS